MSDMGKTIDVHRFFSEAAIQRLQLEGKHFRLMEYQGDLLRELRELEIPPESKQTDMKGTS